MRRHRLSIHVTRAAALLGAAACLVAASSGPLAATAVAAPTSVPLAWVPVPTGSAEDFRGVDAISRDAVWVAGTHGQVLRTVDAGRTWKDVSPPGADAVYFRDIEATSSRHAVLLSVSGSETQAAGRVWVTDDGGATWASPLATTDPRSFFDCLAFASPDRGYLIGDPVDGRFEVYVTRDAGHHWTKADTSRMPPAVDGEFAFAAGGSCMSAVGSTVSFGTGGTVSRVFRSIDGGRTWVAQPTPLVTGPSAGVFAAQFRDERNGIAVGGDIDALSSRAHTSAYTDNGGRTWQESRSMPGGLRTSAVWVSLLPVAIAVGPTGSDISLDAGRSWRPIDTGGWTTLSCAPDLACYAVGLAGKVSRLSLALGS
jgi:photosystem II stability/assembly factor-like uncharacterized protein